MGKAGYIPILIKPNKLSLIILKKAKELERKGVPYMLALKTKRNKKTLTVPGQWIMILEGVFSFTQNPAIAYQSYPGARTH